MSSNDEDTLEERVRRWYERVMEAAFWPLVFTFAVAVTFARGGSWREMGATFIAALVGGVALFAFGIPFLAGWAWVPYALGRWVLRRGRRRELKVTYNSEGRPPDHPVNQETTIVIRPPSEPED